MIKILQSYFGLVSATLIKGLGEMISGKKKLSIIREF